MALPWNRAVVLALLLALLAAGVRFHRSAWSASDLEVTPDSVEYAVAAQRFVTLGRCDIEIEGTTYPSRYPPWFSVLALAPAYAVAPSELGAGIVPVFLFALLGIAAAWSIGRRLAGEWGGVASAALLASEPAFGFLSRKILTDVPAAALALVGCRVFLWMRESRPTRSSWALAGALVALAAAMRTEAAGLALPFLYLAIRRPGRARTIATFLAPLALLAGLTVAYQASAFGDWKRNGYVFWCPVPLDYPAMTFSFDYLAANLKVFGRPWVLTSLGFFVVGTTVLLLRRSLEARGVLVFLGLGVLPASLLHLLFVFPDRRFHLPLIVLACALGGAGVTTLVPERIRERWKLAPALLALVPLALPRPSDPPPYRRIVAEGLAQATPVDAVIVTAIDPVYLEPLVLRGTHRRVVPVSRDVEYASKAVAWKRIETLDPPARGPIDHRSPGLFRGGAKDVVAFTADERPEQLAAWVREGVPVFVDRSFLPRKFPLDRVRALGCELEKVPDRPWLGKLVLASTGG